MANIDLRENPYYELPVKQEDINSYDYLLTEFEDEIVENPWTFELIEVGESQRGNKICSLVPCFGEVIQDGLPLSARNLGNVDVGVYILYKWKAWVNERLLALTLKGDASDGAILNGFLAIQFYATLKDLGDNLIILDGYYDELRGELSV